MKKWSENASREVLNSKIFLTQGKGTPLFLDPIPRSIGPSGLGAFSPVSLGPSGLGAF